MRRSLQIHVSHRPKTEDEPLGADFAAQLWSELNRVQPLHSGPRYGVALPPVRTWRLAPVVFVAACMGIAGMTAWAATGSTNPAVWTKRVETVINPPPPSPTPASHESGSGPSQPAAAPPAAAPTHRPTAEPAEKPEPTQSPEQKESPEPRESPDAGGHHSAEPP